jgi:hypothetical protein
MAADSMMGSVAAANPWSAGIMAAGSVASAALNDKTNMTNGANVSTGFDNSGWSVNLAGRGATAQQTATNDKSSSSLGLPQLMNNPLVLVLLAFVAFEFAKHK